MTSCLQPLFTHTHTHTASCQLYYLAFSTYNISRALKRYYSLSCRLSLLHPHNLPPLSQPIFSINFALRITSNFPNLSQPHKESTSQTQARRKNLLQGTSDLVYCPGYHLFTETEMSLNGPTYKQHTLKTCRGLLWLSNNKALE